MFSMSCLPDLQDVSFTAMQGKAIFKCFLKEREWSQCFSVVCLNCYAQYFVELDYNMCLLLLGFHGVWQSSQILYEIIVECVSNHAIVNQACVRRVWPQLASFPAFWLLLPRPSIFRAMVSTYTLCTLIRTGKRGPVAGHRLSTVHIRGEILPWRLQRHKLWHSRAWVFGRQVRLFCHDGSILLLTDSILIRYWSVCWDGKIIFKWFQVRRLVIRGMF